MAGEDARVLVVDDEPGITDLVSMALRYEGLTVEVAHTGHDALRSVDSFRPHLMVLDVMLPDLDGFEVLRHLSGDHPRVPVIFLTARDGLEDKLRGFTLGGDDYVTKPFSVEELIVRTRAILRRVHEIEEDSGVLRWADLVLDEDQHEVTPRRHGRRADADGVQAAPLPPLEQRPGRLEGSDPRPGVALRLRRERQRRRDLHQLTPPEARDPRTAAHPHGPGRRLPAQAPAGVGGRPGASPDPAPAGPGRRGRDRPRCLRRRRLRPAPLVPVLPGRLRAAGRVVHGERRTAPPAPVVVPGPPAPGEPAVELHRPVDATDDDGHDAFAHVSDRLVPVHRPAPGRSAPGRPVPGRHDR